MVWSRELHIFLEQTKRNKPQFCFLIQHIFSTGNVWNSRPHKIFESKTGHSVVNCDGELWDNGNSGWVSVLFLDLATWSASALNTNWMENVCFRDPRVDQPAHWFVHSVDVLGDQHGSRALVLHHAAAPCAGTRNFQVSSFFGGGPKPGLRADRVMYISSLSLPLFNSPMGHAPPPQHGMSLGEVSRVRGGRGLCTDERYLFVSWMSSISVFPDVYSAPDSVLWRCGPLWSTYRTELCAVSFQRHFCFQAARLSAACNSLRKLGHEIKVRPFGWQDEKEEELDSFLLFQSSLSMKVTFHTLVCWPSKRTGKLRTFVLRNVPIMVCVCGARFCHITVAT